MRALYRFFKIEISTSPTLQSLSFPRLPRVADVFSCAFFLLATSCRAQVVAPLISSSAYPQSAYHLSVANRASLQSALNTYKIVRLDANANYATGGVSQLSIGSAEKLYGLPGTVVPPIIVMPGTEGAVLSCLQTASVTFPPSAEITHDNLFLSIKGGAIAQNATLNNNLVVDWYGGLSLDDSISGHFKNNRFIRSLAHGSYNPYLLLKGNSNDPSFGNVFLFYNFLTPPGDGATISGQTDITFVGVDGESWNWFNWGTQALITTTADVGTFRFFVANGADYIHPTNSPGATGYFDIAAKNFFLYNDISSSASAYKIQLEKTVNNALLWNVPTPNQAGQALKKDGTSTFLYSLTGAVTPAQMVSTQVSSLQTALPLASAIGEVPWEAPVYDPVPDPGGATWNQNLQSMPDSTTYIQNLISTERIAILPAGTYYISQSLRLKSTQGLIGAGMGSTLIIAKNPSIDMIVGNDHVGVDTITGMTLGDLTLEGGLNGIHHAPSGSGAGAQYNLMFLSHVTFRNMSNAGIFIDSIVAWDNNLIDHVNFVNCGTGILQRVSPSYAGGDAAPGQAYLDKNVFYHCQFISNGIALNLPAQRANNLNVWVESLFENNQEGVVRMTNNLSPVFANSDFINNGGAAAFTNDGSNLSIVGSRFTAGAEGKAMFSGTFSIEGSSFQEGGGTASIILSGGILSFYNSYSVDMPLGPIRNGYFFNNRLHDNTALSVQGVSVQNGANAVMLSGAIVANPVPQLLMGGPLAFRY
jgi:hypothetical protein